MYIILLYRLSLNANRKFRLHLLLCYRNIETLSLIDKKQISTTPMKETSSKNYTTYNYHCMDSFLWNTTINFLQSVPRSHLLNGSKTRVCGITKFERGSEGRKHQIFYIFNTEFNAGRKHERRIVTF